MKLFNQHENPSRPTCLEICAGGGGQALGLEQAGFEHLAVVEYEYDYCKVLSDNRPQWNVMCADVTTFDGTPYEGRIDLFAGGVPCPPFSVAGKQMGKDDERDLFPSALRLVREIKPRAVMLENVRGFLDSKFDDYRGYIIRTLVETGYDVNVSLLHASDYGVPQLRPRVVIVGLLRSLRQKFTFPPPSAVPTPTVGNVLLDLMQAGGWEQAEQWAERANSIAPTIVGGSKKHGGPDLGPVRARKAWAQLGVDGMGVANEPPAPGFNGMPRLTAQMIARIQGFPDTWHFNVSKTKACRMIGNAFPPPVAKAVGMQIKGALS